MLENIKIPNKSLFRPEEVCELVKLRPYVLRFWESEFPELAPLITESGKKLYEPDHFKVISILKLLLVEHKINLARAKVLLPKILSGEVSLQLAIERAKNQGTKVKRASGHKDKTRAPQLLVAKKKLEQMICSLESIKRSHHWE